jgi:regulator of PEP synthase PpsR (kinase-PPPase family)
MKYLSFTEAACEFTGENGSMKKPTSRTSRGNPRPSKSQSPPAPPMLYVLSDSTGNLARHMLAAFLTQFPAGSIITQFHTFIRNQRLLDEVLSGIGARPGAICHAMVAENLKEKIASFCRTTRLPHYDLTGGVVEFLSCATGVKPRSDVASLHRIDAGYKRRVGALEFTLDHDDGLGLATLADADIVLVGVSRTGKTPTSIYLAQQGYRVANVSLAIESPPPPQLFTLNAKKVVGLVINPQQLVLIRARRESDWLMSRTSYGEPANVVREVAWARQMFARQGWPILDVTDQAIEETAARIVSLLGLAGPPDGDERVPGLP